MEVLVAKILVLVVIFVVTLICCILPLKVISRNRKTPSTKYQRILSYVNCLSGGVFIGTCFLALQPRVSEMFFKIKALNPVLEPFPLTEITVLVGFFLILFIEQLVSAVQESKKSSQLICEDMSDEMTMDNLNGYTASDSSSDSDQEPKHEIRKLVVKKKKRRSSNRHGHSHNHAGHHSHLPNMSGSNSIIRVLILLTALGSHSLFEGMALGLQDTNDLLLRLAIAVLSHEVLCALAMGTTLAQQNLKTATAIKIAVFFCSLIPAGIGIGMALESVGGSIGTLLSATVQGIATGTFIHVIFFELVPPQIGPEYGRLIKVLFIFIGCVVMGSLSFMHKHVHDDIKSTTTKP